MLRKIIGFLPVFLPALAVWIFMADFMNPFSADSGLYPGQVPWYHWLWLAAAIAGAVLPCFDNLILPGLLTGAVPYLVILASSFLPSAEDPVFIRRFAVMGILFFAAYAVIYIIYHRELNKS